MAKKTSLKDIATLVGVSTALVSYVLNGKEKEGRVSQEKIKKIRQAAKELHYQPNLIAKSHKNGHTRTIGVIVADISNPFFASMAKIIEEEARKSGYIVIFGSSDEDQHKSAYLINVFLSRQVDAFIIAPAAGTEDQIRQIQRTGKPVVLIDRYFPDLPSDCIRVNNRESAMRAVEHQILAGNRQIALLSYKTDLVHIEQRKTGYLKAMQKYGLPVNGQLLLEASYQDLNSEVEQLMRALLYGPQRVEGFFFATNTLALAGLKAIHTLNLTIPGTFSIGSFDHCEVFDFYYAPLSYVEQNIEKLAENAVSLVVKRLEEKAPPRQYRTVIVDTQLVIHENPVIHKHMSPTLEKVSKYMGG